MSGARSLDTLREGESGTVAYLAAPESSEGQRLLSLGLAPGVLVRVDQRWPALVVSVEESLIAMEAAVARGVYVHA